MLRLLTFATVLPLWHSADPEGHNPILVPAMGSRVRGSQNLKPFSLIPHFQLGKLKPRRGRNLLKELQQVRDRARSRGFLQTEALSQPPCLLWYFLLTYSKEAAATEAESVSRGDKYVLTTMPVFVLVCVTVWARGGDDQEGCYRLECTPTSPKRWWGKARTTHIEGFHLLLYACKVC